MAGVVERSPAMATIQQHHIKALTPTWFLVKVTPAPAPREGGSKKAAACSPLLPSPAAWQKAQDERRTSKDGAERHSGGLPASPRISCMGQVKGRTIRACSSARGPAPTRGSRSRGAAGGGGGKVAALVLGLLGRRNARTSRACAKVRDVPGSSRGGVRRGAGAATTTTGLVFDPPLPVVRRPATDENAPSLWERRRGSKALEGLQLT